MKIETLEFTGASCEAATRALEEGQPARGSSCARRAAQPIRRSSSTNWPVSTILLLSVTPARLTSGP